MRLWTVILAAVLIASCGSRESDEQRRREANSPAGKAGQVAHGAAREAGKVAHEAAKGLAHAAHDAREGWKEAAQKDKERGRK